MTTKPSPLRRLFDWISAEDQRVFRVQMLGIFVVITLLNLGSYYQREILAIDLQRNVPRPVHAWDGIVWYIWLLAAPATLVLIRRFPLNRDRVLANTVKLTLGAVLTYLLITNARYFLRFATNRWLTHDPDPVRFDLTVYLHTQSVLAPLDFLTLCGFFATSVAIDYYFKYRVRAQEIMSLQLQAATLQSELTRSQLSTLRGQLHPHFLFNAFNAVSTLVRQGKNEPAVNMITQLSAMLRMSMQNIDLQEVSLDQELDFVNSYLNVEKVRFSDKLQTVLAIDPVTRRCIVPNLLLQPLVENAIKHGISRRITQGFVTLNSSRVGDRLVIEVVDDGPEEDGAQFPHESSGIGLKNTHSRLRHIYRNNYRLDIVSRPEGGTIVRIDLPWREGQPRSTVPSIEHANAAA